MPGCLTTRGDVTSWPVLVQRRLLATWFAGRRWQGESAATTRPGTRLPDRCALREDAAEGPVRLLEEHEQPAVLHQNDVGKTVCREVSLHGPPGVRLAHAQRRRSEGRLGEEIRPSLRHRRLPFHGSRGPGPAAMHAFLGGTGKRDGATDNVPFLAVARSSPAPCSHAKPGEPLLETKGAGPALARPAPSGFRVAGRLSRRRFRRSRGRGRRCRRRSCRARAETRSGARGCSES